jgi:hypothetical protein
MIVIAFGCATKNFEMGGLPRSLGDGLQHRPNRLNIATASAKHAPLILSLKGQPH